MSWIELFPIGALLFFLWAELEQLRITYREKTVQGLSLKKYVISLIINCLFGTYYILLNHWIAFVFNQLLGCVLVAILWFGYKYKREEKDGPNGRNKKTDGGRDKLKPKR